MRVDPFQLLDALGAPSFRISEFELDASLLYQTQCEKRRPLARILKATLPQGGPLDKPGLTLNGLFRFGLAPLKATAANGITSFISHKNKRDYKARRMGVGNRNVR